MGTLVLGLTHADGWRATLYDLSSPAFQLGLVGCTALRLVLAVRPELTGARD